MPDQTPLVQTLRVQVDAVTAAASGQLVLGEAPFAGTVTRAAYIPSAAITGAATNNRTVSVTDRGPAGTGSTVVATLNFAAGTNAAADAAKAVPLAATPATIVAQGDVLTFDSVPAGTGIADPGGTAIVEITRS